MDLRLEVDTPAHRLVKRPKMAPPVTKIVLTLRLRDTDKRIYITRRRNGFTCLLGLYPILILLLSLTATIYRGQMHTN